MQIGFRTVIEAEAGPLWQRYFHTHWPQYRNWYLLEGERNRPRYLTCTKKLKQYMPELVPVYEQLVQLAGGGDLEARFLSMFNPPPFLSGCSQSVWLNGFPALIRNYDYTPKLFEGCVLQTNWLRPVIAMSDCVWGALDGINDAGLSVSLTFGGSKQTGEGFGIPIILRYILETCTTTAEAEDVLRRVPVHMSYNVTVLDKNGYYVTAFLSPKQPTRVHHDLNVTNHQERIEWEAYITMSRSIERKSYLDACLLSNYYTFPQYVRLFFDYPLYSTMYHRGFGTLYTAIYYPAAGYCEYIWPGYAFRCSFLEPQEQYVAINYL
jgi:predicted choloylglycine hydrolase